MKRSTVSEKQKRKSNENENAKIGRFLITVNVLGSAGPIRFVVSEDDSVAAVIGTALKLLEINCCVLNDGSLIIWDLVAALALSESIGLCGGRNFVLCKKQSNPQMTEARSEMVGRKGSSSSSWKAWLNKSFHLRVLSH
ncbi:hypothetical protein RJ640_010932 [Escallonia rubra]|uniref:DUF7054 domain-containing protein n=1 Tax=Escallonia rubra TaxID=112253 RepID=A0AA88RD90_9ASTE|nr:hypothetical protein RJ640_010932 [Escallonia rubra]